MSADDPRFLKGIEHFNKREYYDAHEVWEDLWHELQGDDNLFVQGLIQFATALHHFEARNLKGARILYDGGVELLSPLGESRWGVSIRRLLDQMAACMKDVLPYAPKELPGRYHPNKNEFPVKLKEDTLPRIEREGARRG